MYSLVPLLGTRELDISPTTKRTIHLALADGIMKKRALGPLEVLKAFTHFASADSLQQAAGLLLMVLMDFNDLEDIPEDWGISEVWAHVELPAEIDLTLR